LDGLVQSIWRHPLKGFTPEPLDHVVLTAGACFPFDRLYAVEDGPSGFDPLAPRHLSKQKLTVLAKLPVIARVRTRYDEVTGMLEARFDDGPPIRARLDEQAGREAFAAWLSQALGGEANGRLKVLPAPGAHRFMDDVLGFISIINLASVRDLADRIERTVDPRRFRANFYIDGWPAWAENDASGHHVRLGEVDVEICKPIVRCVATHVDPDTGERDINIVRSLFDAFGHTHCGVYARVVGGGRVGTGDGAMLEMTPPAVAGT
jgi:uncharacterized protein